jgi:ketosteroid isomerase-like protein
MDVGKSCEEKEIFEIVDRETQAWNNKDVDRLLTVFHPDMVWPWPKTSGSHDPLEWIFGMGRFDYLRWKQAYSELFDAHRLIHNVRNVLKIVISEEGDGAFAVVDVDTLWQDIKTNEDFHWKGRACKIYTRVKDGQWKMIAHTGLLDYGAKD